MIVRLYATLGRLRRIGASLLAAMLLTGALASAALPRNPAPSEDIVSTGTATIGLTVSGSTGTGTINLSDGENGTITIASRYPVTFSRPRFPNLRRPR